MGCGRTTAVLSEDEVEEKSDGKSCGLETVLVLLPFWIVCHGASNTAEGRALLSPLELPLVQEPVDER